MKIKKGTIFFHKGNNADFFKIVEVTSTTIGVTCNGHIKIWQIPLLDAQRYFATKFWVIVEKLPRIDSGAKKSHRRIKKSRNSRS